VEFSRSRLDFSERHLPAESERWSESPKVLEARNNIEMSFTERSMRQVRQVTIQSFAAFKLKGVNEKVSKFDEN
jgi:hypothetical protein